MSEAETQSQILAAYQGHPLLRLWRNNVGAAKIGNRFVRFGLPGSSDLMGVLAPSGRAVFIEVKSTDGLLRKAQVAFKQMVMGQGAIWILARSLDDVTKVVPL